jgi:hypothetical protein
MDGHDRADQEDSRQRAETGARRRVTLADVALGVDHSKHQDGHEDPEQGSHYFASSRVGFVIMPGAWGKSR